jgi:ABC-type transport system substrate-binding protein
MDRDEMTKEYTSGFGLVVNGYYGIEQWEYLICTGQLEYPINFISDETHTDEDLEEWAKHPNMYATSEEELERMQAAWEMLSLDHLKNYNVYDLEKDPDRTEKTGIETAKALLDSAHWTLNREGNPYDPEKDDVRCKMIDGELVALDLTMMYPEGNRMAEIMEENFLNNLAEVGIKVTLVPEKMEELLKSYYREKERTTDMIYLATNFHVIVDPSITYSADKTANHLIWNNTYSDDEDLYYRAVNMRQTDPKDVYDYVSKWISFQERYNEVLPAIPIYSNIYFDFYTSELQNYHVTGHVTWSQAILQSYFGEPMEIAPAEEEGTEDGELMLED